MALQWANVRPFGWGSNGVGQLADGTRLQRALPVPANTTLGSVLCGKTVTALAAGQLHSLALCSDGTVTAWGSDFDGALGDNHTGGIATSPVAVNVQPGLSALYGKRVIALAAGGAHSLALCDDGTVLAWGANLVGELGDNSCSNRWVPVAVNTQSGVSALYGKRVVAIAAAAYHSLALCSDGIVTAWGINDASQLGDNTTTNRCVPVAVNAESGVSALYGKQVVAIAAGSGHSLALCSDGTVAIWGQLHYLSNDTTLPVPTTVDQSAASALYGKTVVAIAAGADHDLALCSDGTVAAWGVNRFGQLGNNSTNSSGLMPMAVNTDAGLSALNGRTVVAISAGHFHSVALCSDGTVTAWGMNLPGALGDGTTVSRRVPVVVQTTPLATGERFKYVATGSSASHTLALVAGPVVSPIIQPFAPSIANGSLRFAFTNTAGAAFNVLVTTNPSAPLTQWSLLNGIIETAPGQYQFTDPQKMSNQQRYYRVTSP